MKKIRNGPYGGAILIASLILSVALGVGVSFGQKVRLRAELTPNCQSFVSPARWMFADLYADGNIAVQGTYGCRGAFIYDISNPNKPVLANWYNPGSNQQFLEAIVVGNRAYFGSGNGGGVHIVDVSDPYHPVLLGTVDSAHGNGWNSIHEMMIYDQAGVRYLIENFNSTGTLPVKFINISDPTTPVFKYQYVPSDNGWIHAMHIRGNRMFTSEYSTNGVEILDISNLATQAPTLINRILSNTTNHSTWTSEDGNYLYSCRETQDGDVRVYDIHDVNNPFLVRTIKAGDIGINAHTPHNPVVMGNKLYVSWYQAGIQIFDISDPSNPRRIGQYDTFQNAYAPSAKKSLADAEPWDVICGASNLQNALPTDYDGDWAVFPFLGEDKVIAGDLTSGLLILDASKVSLPAKNVVSDFDGDGRTDVSMYTPSNGNWGVSLSSTQGSLSTSWGQAGDIVTPGDFDGDGKADFGIYRPSTGIWYVLTSNNTVQIAQWGAPGDQPVQADYDADGTTDLAIWRPSTGVWYILRSTLSVQIIQWGAPTDKVFPADFDGDGKPDIAVWRPSNSVWYVLYTSSSLVSISSWGDPTDKPLVADFDGDGKVDLAVYRPSNGVWYILNSASNSVSIYQFGLPEDIPVPADYDGDGKADIAEYRPSQNNWYRLNSNGGGFVAQNFGQAGDLPLPAMGRP